jgi:hypothetical protein
LPIRSSLLLLLLPGGQRQTTTAGAAASAAGAAAAASAGAVATTTTSSLGWVYKRIPLYDSSSISYETFRSDIRYLDMRVPNPLETRGYHNNGSE